MLNSSHIHHKCGDIVYSYSGFTRASDKIDSGTPHFLFVVSPRGVRAGKYIFIYMDKELISSVIGVRLVLSKRIGVEKHNECDYVLFPIGIVFVLCLLMAFLNFIGFDI